MNSLLDGKVTIEFSSDQSGVFEMKVSEDLGIGSLTPLEWTAPMTRKESEELLFQMAFILGYKVA